MQKTFEVENHLGYRILRWVLLVALLSGILMSAVQVVLDAKRVSAELERDAAQTLAMVEDSATQERVRAGVAELAGRFPMERFRLD